jgi:hypothetical protein
MSQYCHYNWKCPRSAPIPNQILDYSIDVRRSYNKYPAILVEEVFELIFSDTSSNENILSCRNILPKKTQEIVPSQVTLIKENIKLKQDIGDLLWIHCSWGGVFGYKREKKVVLLGNFHLR